VNRAVASEKQLTLNFHQFNSGMKLGD